ncbi:MAG: SRPBCC family protein [Dehalococcoidia bacterium]|nr:SRPBCC family protein [Dehalococcoidia bacterium]
MTTLTDSIEIKTAPERVFNGLFRVFSSEEDFKRWHKDHVKCQWLRGKPFEAGSILYVEEYLHGGLHKMKFLGTRLEPNRRVEYRLLFPGSIVCPRGSFIMEPKGESCIFTATLSFRMGWIFSAFAKNRVDAVRRHMKEEGENLKKISETDATKLRNPEPRSA